MIRRTPPHKPTQLSEAAKKVVLGPAKFRRVWLKSDPRGRTDPMAPHWFVDAHSREGAINDMARRMKRPASEFDAEKL